MERRLFLAQCSATALLIVTASPAKGQSRDFGRPVQVMGGGKVADLKTQLESGLRARRPQEFRFIARVVRLVERKRLTMKIVQETFHWARRKRPYPYPYFERAMKIRAFAVTTWASMSTSPPGKLASNSPV